MTREELIENLGTIAKSGTAAFAENLQAANAAGDEGATSALIGQLGLAFIPRSWWPRASSNLSQGRQ